MKLPRALIGLVILCSVASAASRTSVYRNKEYGIFLPIPSGAWFCSIPREGIDHGAAFLLGTKDESLCTKSSGKRVASIFAGYVTEDSKTLHSFLNSQCAYEGKGACGQAPAGLRIHGVSTEAARVDQPNGLTTIIVVAQARNSGLDSDASVSSMNYEFSLDTDAVHLDEDLVVFRAILNSVRIASHRR